MSLARISRYQLLKTRKESACQGVARFAMDMNPAEFGFNYFYPLLSHHRHLVGKLIPEKPINTGQLFQNYPDLCTDWRRINRSDVPRWTLLKMKVFMSQYFPDRVDVESTKTELIRFVSYHTVDYCSWPM